METPHTKAGQLTEEIMAEWLKQLWERKEPKPNTPTYNAAYEACLVVLGRGLQLRTESEIRDVMGDGQPLETLRDIK